MKKMLSFFSAMGLVASSTSSIVSMAKNEIFADINNVINFSGTQRVDAGTRGWIKDTSDDNKFLRSNLFTIDLKDLSNKYPNFYENLSFKYGIGGSEVDINDGKKNPFENYNDATPILKWSDIKDGAIVDDVNDYSDYCTTKDPVGYAISKGGSDYDEAYYYIKYAFNKDKSSFYTFVEMDSHAHNGGNGNINTMGKGTNLLKWNSLDIIFKN